MSGSNSREAHLLQGWVSAIGLGVLTCGIALFAYGLSWLPAILMGLMVTLIIGLVFSFAMGGGSGSETQQMPQAPALLAERAATGAVSATKADPAPQAPVQQDLRQADPDTDTTNMAPSGGAALVDRPAPDADAPVAAAAPAQSAPASPAMLDGPQGVADDLKRINGVGPVLEGKLNKMGVYHFWQIAGWSQAEIDWVDATLNFKGRIQRDNWITQAQRLAQQSPAKPD
ncbi:MAG: hypothetical protein JJT99_05455 [Rhodobacteraceae bacterium]|nr:hypothetical protein [Paracoccaceae bacterium]